MYYFLAFILFFNVVQASLNVDQIVRPFISKNSIPDMAIGVFYKGHPEFYYYGRVKKDTIFEIASITKVFTSTLLALAVQEGKVNLQDPVIKYFPLIHGPAAPFRHMTLEELATHSSSLPRDPPRNLKLNNFLTHWHPAYPIGTRYLYSNFGYGLLGHILAEEAHTSYYQLIRQKILMPLNMHSTFVDVPEAYQKNFITGFNPKNKPVGKPEPMRFPGGGALKSSIGDMMQFLQANMGDSLAKKLVSAMQLAQKPYFKANDHLALGLGWQLFQGKAEFLIDKNGGLPGFSSYIGMNPKKNIGVVILINKGKSNATALGRQLLHDLN